MSEDANPPEAAEPAAKPVEDKAPEGKTAGEKPAKKAKKKSAKKPKSEDKVDAKSDEPSKESKDSKEAKKDDGKDAKSEDGKNPRRRRSRGGSSKPSRPSKNHDPELLAKHAWKIYLAEISEEGVTMIDDAAAKVLARRCFELAATFLDEKEHRS